MLRLDRSRSASRWLAWKVRLFTAGAVLAVVGMALEETWMTTTAMVVLLAGFLLRFLPERDGDPETPDDGTPTD